MIKINFKKNLVGMEFRLKYKDQVFNKILFQLKNKFNYLNFEKKYKKYFNINSKNEKCVV